MELIKATDVDNEELLHYFAKTPLPGSIDLQFRRMFHFFNQYRVQSSDYVTYTLKNSVGQIEALASLVFRQAYIENKKETVCFATDLRVSPTRRAILTWAHHFLPALEAERKTRGCNYVFSVVPHSQRQAYNTFIRPRNVKRKMPRYHLFRKFDVVSLHGLWPFHDLPLSGIKVRSARSEDFDQVCEYLIEKTTVRPLKYFSKPQEVRAHIEAWHDLSIANFLIALDSTGKIIGCTGIWSPERVQRVYPLKYDDRAQNFRDILKLFSIFGFAHNLPKIGEELELRHLTHMFADNPDILYSLLYNAYLTAGNREVLLYPHFHGELLTLPPRSFISARQEFGLYCILSPQDPVPNFLRPTTLQSPPVFEPAFL